MSLSAFIECFRDLIRQELSSLRYRDRWPARVVGQAADGTVELVPDDSTVPGQTGVPLRLGIPGATAKVSVGTRVLMAFERFGAHWRPIADLWETGSVAGDAPEEITIPATARVRLGQSGHVAVARLNDQVDCGTWVFDSSSPTTITITYTPRGGVPQVVPITLGAGPAGAIMTAGPIVSASSHVEAS